jgi:ADP-ribose pyrophosphatase YjhB (NUDIX family)
VREVREESGLDVDVNSLQPLAVWEGAVSSRKKQFCVIFFAADAMCDNAQQCNMELQMKEVHRAAWVPRDLLPRILDSHVLHSDLEIDGVLIENDEQLDTKVKMSELQSGLGEGHKFALRAYLDSLDKKQSEVSKTLQNAASFSLAERQRVSEARAGSSSPRGVPPPPPSWGRGVSRLEGYCKGGAACTARTSCSNAYMQP